MLEIDGSYGEGGGQIIRTAVSLAIQKGLDLKVINIRANRRNPGLAAQHITAVKAAAKLCNGSTSDLQVGSKTLIFKPGKLQSGEYSFNIGTAGSIVLVLQTCLLPSLLSEPGYEFTFRIKGGTDVQWSPSYDYFKLIFLEHLKTLGAEASATLIKRGYYPKGGGEIYLRVRSIGTKNKLNLIERGRLNRIDGVINISLLSGHIAERILSSAKEYLLNKVVSDIPIEIGIEMSNNSFSPGTGILLRSVHQRTVLGSIGLGRPGFPAKRVGAQAAAGLADELLGSGAVDIHAADQLIPYLGISGGGITVYALSEHTKTNLWLVEQFIGSKLQVEEYAGMVKISS